MMYFFKKRQKTQFDELIEVYSDGVYKHAFWMVGRKDLAEDMVQDTFFQAWKSFSNLREKNSVFPWLLTILRRQIYREQRLEYRNLEMLAELKIITENDVRTDAQLLLELYQSLESVTLQQREIFLLHHLHGFSYQEISDQLQIPMGTVMSRISRVKEILKSVQQRQSNGKVLELKTHKNQTHAQSNENKR